MSNFQHRSRAEPTLDRLCQACSKLDLWRDALLSRRTPSYSEKVEISLGRFRDVQSRRYCPLCRLTKHLISCGHEFLSIKKGTLPYASDDDEILICHTGGTPEMSVELTGSFGVFSHFYFLGSEVSREEGAVQGLYNAQLLDDKMIDLRLINKWRRECERSHKGTCDLLSIRRAQVSVSLRFIDVDENCIVDGDLSYRYVALSYVWGKTKSLRLLKKNKTRLYKKESLEERWEDLPLTIKDVISLTRDLRERYLWIDSLCLVQDDANDVESGLQVMDLIYECAELTVIAAAGPDANSGLPGYTPCSCKRQVTERINDLTLLSVQDMTFHVDASEYGKRAWTFQERFLSRRSLIFADNKVYWQCREMWQSEEQSDPTPLTNNQSFSIFLPEFFQASETARDPYYALDLCVHYYSNKQLTFEGDALRAVSGLLGRISRSLGCRLLYGLPIASFDLGMIFQKGNRGTLSRRKLFPSWSWAGWQGKMLAWHTSELEKLARDEEWFTDDHDKGKALTRWLNTKTWIVWYKRSSKNVVTPVWDPAANPAWRADSSDHPGYSLDEPEGMGRERALGLPAGVDLKGPRGFPTEPTLEQLDWIRVQPHPYHLLQFWTVTAEFDCTFERLIDKSGSRCGWIEWDGYDNSGKLVPTSVKLAILSGPWDSSKPLKDSFLGEDDDFRRARRGSARAGSPLAPVYRDPDPQYWALAIRPANGGYVERKGLCRLWKTALLWSIGDVRWEEVILG